MIRVWDIPGGQTTGDALARLGELARAYGSGLLQLTSRGSVQIRGLAEVPPDAVADGITAADSCPRPAMNGSATSSPRRSPDCMAGRRICGA